MSLAAGLGVAPAALLLDVAVLAWFASEVWVASQVRRGSRHGGPRERSDQGSFLVVFVGIFVAITASNLLRGAGVGLLPGWTVAVGLALLGTGIAVRLWAVRSLGRFFSYVVELQSEHRIVTAGPYRWLRHPSYTGVILAALGYAVIVGSWAGALVVAAGVGGVIGYRVSVEERALLARFGPEYRVYIGRTWRLFPFLV
ncbi:MAG: isoprenylcysteine carboxylmethyltransferase family protein [Thermoplasmata archaeon]|nr:isoprenylcysteine carboxylmethyltransferase family protein [Thermoplasmata archaeon]